jgi:hypothetical protein
MVKAVAAGATRALSCIAIVWSLGAGAQQNNITIVDNGVEKTIDCTGREVNLLGNRGHFTLEGACRSVHVQGNANQVSVNGSMLHINALGNDNEIVWTLPKGAQAPKIANLGHNNHIVKKE